ncbi:YoaK family protein [Amycolatopsis sp. NPDC005232]|uniref:YoaK family protein n=1 Tax=Amycolatopsis sp. NPDC005232 TaxID=3157027 RepID=UPI0033BAF808
MLALTFSTGIVDAVGYLGLDKVFTGNMTGNVVVLGMALVGSDDLPITGPALALVGFMAGAAAAGRSLRGTRAGWNPRVSGLLAVVTLAVLIAAVVLLAEEVPTPGVRIAVTTALGAAMGAQAATARFIAVKDVTTVVITSTITGMAADLGLTSGWGTAFRGLASRRAAAVVLMIVGALIGAALVHWHRAAGLFLAAAVIGVATLAGSLHARFTSDAG